MDTVCIIKRVACVRLEYMGFQGIKGAFYRLFFSIEENVSAVRCSCDSVYKNLHP